jgi:hypothetical protein
MNVVVTPHQSVCLYSAIREEGELLERVHWLNGGPADARNILIVFSITSSGTVFFGPSAFRSLCVFSRIELVTKNNLASQKGYC